MKKEKVKKNKNVLLMAGVTASIVMIIIVLFFSLSSITTMGTSITGNVISLKESGQSSESYTKQEIEVLLEKKFHETINEKYIFNETLIIKELSGNGNAYLCINSKGKIFRSENPCK